jgi:hypothetical protein
MVIGTAALLAGWYSGLVSLPGDHLGYERILRWEIPGGERWFIAVDPLPASEELRALGNRLRKYIKSSGRSEDRLSIYDTYPGVQEVVRYDSVPAK